MKAIAQVTSMRGTCGHTTMTPRTRMKTMKSDHWWNCSQSDFLLLDQTKKFFGPISKCIVLMYICLGICFLYLYHKYTIHSFLCRRNCCGLTALQPNNFLGPVIFLLLVLVVIEVRPRLKSRSSAWRPVVVTLISVPKSDHYNAHTVHLVSCSSVTWGLALPASSTMHTAAGQEFESYGNQGQ